MWLFLCGFYSKFLHSRRLDCIHARRKIIAHVRLCGLLLSSKRILAIDEKWVLEESVSKTRSIYFKVKITQSQGGFDTRLS